MDAVFVPVQPDAAAGVHDPVRPHVRRPADRPADRRPDVRRCAGAARRARLRIGAADSAARLAQAGLTRFSAAVSADPITDLDAHALSRAIHARAVSCVEVMRAYLARIHRINPKLNAIVNLAPDDTLMAQAAQRDDELQRDLSRGFLHGMPQAIKDAASAVGFPTT